MTECENGGNVLKCSDLLLMELRFYLVMLCLKCKGDQLDNFWNRGLRIQEVGLDVSASVIPRA